MRGDPDRTAENVSVGGVPRLPRTTVVPRVGRIPSTSWLLVAGGVLLLLVGASVLTPGRREPQPQRAHHRR